jgi:pimeloyl-ACP methyl ester carboxylesterase
MSYRILSAIVLATGLSLTAAAADIEETYVSERPTVVLVHGAFANADCWSGVVKNLRSRNVRTLSVQLPLTSLEDDAAATRAALRKVGGKVVLVGHSWGGTVITETGADNKVIALVYVAAFAPDIGQSSAEQGKKFPTPPGSAGKPDIDGLLRLTEATFARDFAQDLDPVAIRQLFTSQGPIKLSALLEPVTAAAWKTRPSWYVLTELDRMISPELQEATARRIGARVHRLPTSHVAMLVKPAEVADVILEAMESPAVPLK